MVQTVLWFIFVYSVGMGVLLSVVTRNVVSILFQLLARTFLERALTGPESCVRSCVRKVETHMIRALTGSEWERSCVRKVETHMIRALTGSEWADLVSERLKLT
jgi:hypothetical protein